MIAQHNGKEPKISVSVVVPIYMVEQYLKQCIDSLLAQTLQDIEIILVDDGSKDSSGTIANYYASSYSNIKVIHQENHGLGPARNTGLTVASGEYIGFVDSDDWVLPNMYCSLYEAARIYKADIVCGGYSTYTNGEMTKEFEHPLAGTIMASHKQIMQMRKNLYGHKPGDKETKSFPVTVWSNIYRRDFIEQNNLLFRKIMSEDTMFNLSAFAQAKSIVFSDCVGYCYRKDEQSSITRTFSPQTLSRYEEFIDALALCAQKESETDRTDCVMRVRYAAVEYARLYAGVIAQSKLTEKEKCNEMKRLVKSSLFLKYALLYPVEKLHPYQKLFHRALLNRHFFVALQLVSLRQALKWVK